MKTTQTENPTQTENTTQTKSHSIPMTDQPTTVTYDPSYSASEYRLFEVSSDIADKLENGLS